jgi:signal peptidase II
MGATGDVEQTPAHPSASRFAIVFGTAITVIALDQLTKWWALESLGDGRVIDVVWTLRLRVVFNSGASFSMGDGLGPLIGLAAIGIVVILIWTGRSISSPVGAVALGLVLGGASGNLLDRLFRAGDGFLGGSVVDFIDVQWWPVWNVADMGVVVGAILLVAVGWNEGRRAPA